MADLRENSLIYLATLLTLSTIALSLLLDVQSGGPIRYLAPVFGCEWLVLGFFAVFYLAPVWRSVAWRKLHDDHNSR